MVLHARPLDGAQFILLGMVDLTERKRGERERELLARELNHRVKNILAVVQSLAMQTDHSRSVEEFRDNFVGRLSALARAHSLLLDRNGGARTSGSWSSGRSRRTGSTIRIRSRSRVSLCRSPPLRALASA